MSAVERYRGWDAATITGAQANLIKAQADAAIAELEDDHAAVAKAYDERYSELIEARATIERLKVCGNCKSCGWVIQPEAFLTLRCAHDDHAVELPDHCQLTPTRWEQP